MENTPELQPKSPSGRTRAARWAPYVIIVTVITTFHGRRLPHIHREVRHDLDWLETCYLYEAARKTVVEFHQFPFRTHFLAGGFPALGHPFDPSIAPEMVLVLLFGVAAGLCLHMYVLHLVTGIGTYLYVRHTLRLHRLSALYSSLVISLCSFIPTRIGSNVVNECVYAWLPLALFLLARLRRRPASLVGLVLVLAAAMATGGTAWAAMALYLGAFVPLHAVRCRWPKAVVRPWWLVGILLGVVGAMALIAPKVVTAFEVLRGAGLTSTTPIRGHADIYAPPEIECLSWPELAVNLVSHRFYADRHQFSGIYVGIVPLVLAAAGSVMAARRWWRHVVLLAISVCLVVAWHSPIDIFSLLWRLPIVCAIDEPVRYFSFFVVFEIAILAGAGGELLVKWAQRVRWVKLAAVPVAANVVYLFFENVIHVVAVEHPPTPVHLPKGEFYQVASVGPPGRSQSVNRAYFCMQHNIGTTDAIFRLYIREVAQPRYFVSADGRARANSAYRGEAYFLTPGNQVAIRRMSPNEIRLSAKVKRPDTLVVNQNHHRSWRTDTGRVVCHDGLLAVQCEAPGDYEVRLRYVPVSAWAGIVLSLATVVVLAVMLRRLYGVRVPRLRRVWTRLEIDLARGRQCVLALLALSVCLAAVLAAYLGYVRPRATADRLTHLGREAMRDRDPGRAEEPLKTALRNVPHHVPARLCLARCYLVQGKHREAAAVLEAAVDPLDPSPEPARLLALAYASLGRPEDGERVVRRALVHHPLVADVHASLAACLAIEGRDGEALQSLERAAELGHGDVAWARRTEAFSRLRRSPRFAAILRDMHRFTYSVGDSFRAPLRVEGP